MDCGIKAPRPTAGPRHADKSLLPGFGIGEVGGVGVGGLQHVVVGPMAGGHVGEQDVYKRQSGCTARAHRPPAPRGRNRGQFSWLRNRGPRR